jgi:hypothetical protein
VLKYIYKNQKGVIHLETRLWVGKQDIVVLVPCSIPCRLKRFFSSEKAFQTASEAHPVS